MIQNLIDSLEYTIKSTRNLLNKKEIIQENNKTLQEALEKEKDYLIFIKGAKEKYQIAVNELYEESIVALQDTLNAALKYIMYDKNYSAKLVLEDARGTKSLSIVLVDEDDGFEVDLKDGGGQGV